MFANNDSLLLNRPVNLATVAGLEDLKNALPIRPAQSEAPATASENGKNDEFRPRRSQSFHWA